MEKNFTFMTTKELEELQKMISMEIEKKKAAEKAKAKNRVVELLDKIQEICIDNNLNLYYTDDYCNDYKLSMSCLYIC